MPEKEQLIENIKAALPIAEKMQPLVDSIEEKIAQQRLEEAAMLGAYYGARSGQ